MIDPSKTNQELLEETALLKHRIQELEKSEAELKQAEEALRQREQQLRDTAEQIPGVIYQFYAKPDSKIGLYYVSESAHNIFGLSSNPEGFFQLFSARVAPECLKSFTESITEAISAVKPWRYEGRFIKDSGESIWFLGLSNPVASGREVLFNGVLLDITDRKRAEEESRRLVSIVRYSRELVNLAKPDGMMVFLNDAGKKMLGITEEEVTKTNIMEVISDHLREKVQKELLVSIHRDGYWEGDLQYLNIKTGDLTDVHAITYKITNPETGELQFLANVSLDINERKRAEEALKKSEEMLRMITDNMSDMIRVSDLQGINSYVSPSHLKVLGYRPEERVGKSNFDIVHPDDIETIINVFSEGLAGNRRVTAEYRARHADGYYVWLETVGDLLRDAQGKVESVVMSSRDVSERKAVIDALKNSEEKYRTIIENMEEGYHEVDIKGSFTFFNESMRRIMGYEREELLGLNNRQFADEENTRKVYQVYNRVFRTGEPVKNFEWQIIRKDGDRRDIDVSISLMRNTDGRPTGFRGIVRDTTDRKRAEEERRRLEQHLQHAEKMEAIGTLAGGIAHDFNNLLMGIQGYASLSLMNIDPSHPNYERIRRIEDQVQSGADLTRQLLGFARGGRYEVKPADMNDILEKSSSMFGRTKKEISIHWKYGKDLWTVEVDQGQMEQVFMNLYVNAWQAMPGGGEIYLETEKIVLDDEQAASCAVKPGRYIKISVTDTGTGMDEKTRERIFDPFFTTKEMGRGTGLGLATVYGIIKGHGGMINVDSEPGHGTMFTIYLPASAKEIAKEKNTTSIIAKGTETILLVDDEKMVLEVSKELLESMGYRVYAVGSGQEAIAVFMEKRNEIDLVILDMIMPGIS